MRPFDASLPMALLRARETTMRRFRPLLAEHDLTEQQWRVLRALTATEDPLDAGDLADRTFLLAPSLSRILANLDDRRLLARQPDPADQRRTLISLTTRGVELVRTVAPESERRYNAIESEFGADRLQTLLGELHELARLDETIR
jgi:homoprotocatechuate degradation regulator HpaR